MKERIEDNTSRTIWREVPDMGPLVSLPVEPVIAARTRLSRDDLRPDSGSLHEGPSEVYAPVSSLYVDPVQMIGRVERDETVDMLRVFWIAGDERIGPRENAAHESFHLWEVDVIGNAARPWGVPHLLHPRIADHRHIRIDGRPQDMRKRTGHRTTTAPTGVGTGAGRVTAV